MKYFRHPALQSGDTPEKMKALAQFLAERDYIVAPVTLDHNDFIFAYTGLS